MNKVTSLIFCFLSFTINAQLKKYTLLECVNIALEKNINIQQSEFDLAQFDKKFARFQGETKTKILNSGVELSGSGLRILRANAEQAELEKDIMDYNAKINQAKTFEQLKAYGDS